MIPGFSELRNRDFLARKEVRDGIVVLLVLLVGVLSFILGRLSVGEGRKETALSVVLNEEALKAAPTGAIPGGVVASKTGSKYHLPWCAGAQTIREENKVWFASAEEARRAGYAPAGNCKGIE